MKRVFQFSLIVLILSSCAAERSGYIPSGQCFFINHTPMLDSAGDVRGIYTIGINHIEGQLAYSPINHFEVIGDMYRFFDTSISNVSSYEVGAGYYSKVLKNNFEILAAFSKSFQKHYNTYDWNFLNSDEGVNSYYLKNHSFSILLNYKVPLSINSNSWCFIASIKNEAAFYDNFHYLKLVKMDNGSLNHQAKFIYENDLNLTNKLIDFIYIAPTIEYSKNGLTFFTQGAFRHNLNEIYNFQFYRNFQISMGIGIHLNYFNSINKHSKNYKK